MQRRLRRFIQFSQKINAKNWRWKWTFLLFLPLQNLHSFREQINDKTKSFDGLSSYLSVIVGLEMVGGLFRFWHFPPFAWRLFNRERFYTYIFYFLWKLNYQQEKNIKRVEQIKHFNFWKMVDETNVGILPFGEKCCVRWRLFFFIFYLLCLSILIHVLCSPFRTNWIHLFLIAVTIVVGSRIFRLTPFPLGLPSFFSYFFFCGALSKWHLRQDERNRR